MTKRKVTHSVWLPLDDAARDGAIHCVRDNHGHPHAACFRENQWRYSNGLALDRIITEYVARVPTL